MFLCEEQWGIFHNYIFKCKTNDINTSAQCFPNTTESQTVVRIRIVFFCLLSVTCLHPSEGGFWKALNSHTRRSLNGIGPDPKTLKSIHQCHVLQGIAFTLNEKYPVGQNKQLVRVIKCWNVVMSLHGLLVLSSASTWTLHYSLTQI